MKERRLDIITVITAREDDTALDDESRPLMAHLNGARSRSFGVTQLPSQRPCTSTSSQWKTCKKVPSVFVHVCLSRFSSLSVE